MPEEKTIIWFLNYRRQYQLFRLGIRSKPSGFRMTEMGKTSTNIQV